MFCRHKYIVLDKLTPPSKLEVIVAQGYSMRGRGIGVLEGLVYVKHKTILSCTKCGRVKTISCSN